MNNISIDQLEQKIEAGEEIIDTYFDPETTKIGIPYQITKRKNDIVTTNINFPSPIYIVNSQ